MIIPDRIDWSRRCQGPEVRVRPELKVHSTLLRWVGSVGIDVVTHEDEQVRFLPGDAAPSNLFSRANQRVADADAQNAALLLWGESREFLR